MTSYDPKSNEWKELQELEEQQIEQELGRCPGPVDLWATALDRRGFFKVGMGGLLSLLLAQWLDPRMAYAQAPAPKAKACILLWMNGGPSQLDTWDPKPGTPTGGLFKAIPTSVKEISICEHLPAMAEQTHHLAILRSMTSKEGNHKRAQYLMHTGYAPNPTITHPSLGGWFSEERGNPNGDLPDFVSISGPSFGAGFLGVQYGPLVVQNPNQMPQNVAYAPDVTPGRFEQRRSALNMLESDFAAQTQDIKVTGREAVYARAIRMMRSPKLKAFDISEEPDSVKAAYGASNFGHGCLMARRLVEAGVRFVEVVLDGWDTHNNNFDRNTRLMGALDPAMA